MRYIFCLLSILIYANELFAALSGDWNYIEKRLQKKGLHKNYISALKSSYDDKDLETVIKLNVLLFLKTSDYHGVQVSNSAKLDIQPFLNKHKTTLNTAEKKWGVSQNVIVSLLWMETRHGKNYGNFHVPSVFLNLIQSERKDVINFLQTKATDFSSKVTKKQRLEIVKRTRKKADWAIQELVAMQTLFKKDPDKIKSLKGSFSGAFGMSQFLPSSYKNWAKTQRGNVAPDLFRADDAIHSVGFYLKDHGWKQKNKKSHVKTLMKYNNSRDYAEAILKIAKMLPTKNK